MRDADQRTYRTQPSALKVMPQRKVLSTVHNDTRQEDNGIHIHPQATRTKALSDLVNRSPWRIKSGEAIRTNPTRGGGLFIRSPKPGTSKPYKNLREWALRMVSATSAST